MIRAVVLVLAAGLALPPMARAQAPPLSVRAEGGSARVLPGHVLAEAALEDALQSGLPLRLRFRVELWRERFFDELVDRSDWTVLLAFEPLERRYLIARDGADQPEVHPSYADARAAIERPYSPPLRATRPGRYYYLASLEIESLTLSDLEELDHWLRGELGPAVTGRSSVLGALGTGLRRALIRMLRLPTRQYQARSPVFEVP